MDKQLCMFCGQEIDADDLTMEHFVPKGLWEKGRRPNQMKTVPAHESCNQAYSSDNEYFRDVMLVEDGVERHPEAREVQNGAISRKIKNRFGSLAKNLMNVGRRSVRTPAGIELGNQPTFEVDWPRIERVLCNVMKGAFYVSQKHPLPSHFEVSASDANSVNQDWLKRTVSFMCGWQSFGDTVFCCRYVRSSKEPIEKFTCLMQFYEHRVFIGEAIDLKLLGEGGELFVPARSESQVLVPRWAADR